MSYRPSRSRLMKFKDVPTGAVVCDLEGFWGVVVRANGIASCFSANGLDRWDAPSIKVGLNELVYVPYSQNRSQTGKP